VAAEEVLANRIHTLPDEVVFYWGEVIANYDGVALWMKIAHWRPGDDPVATLLKSYTYLDGLAPPQYP
jgi:hypothetical protein